MDDKMQSSTANRPPRSPGLRSHRTLSSNTNSSIDDDNVSLSSSYSGSLRKSSALPKISTGDFSAMRAAVGISRMKQERRGRKSVALPEYQSTTLSEGINPRSGRRASIYSLSELAGAGAKVKRRRRSTLENWGRRTTPGVYKYFDKHLPSVELFRRCGRLVQMLASLCQYKFEKENENTEVAHTVFTQYINDDETKIDGGLAFDASFFKANRKMRVSAEVKNILSTPPDQRNEQQLGKILFSLRSIRAFAEYPQRIQHKLINVGWYEAHSLKRAILRQGHIPQAFYFVLSGSAVVTVMSNNESFARTVHFLRRGDSFGELAILHDTQRQSTVISREPIELLVISREDFIDIFMLAGGIKNLNDPDHQKFIRGIEFLKGWPTELLADNPKKCLFHFFRSGSVLVKDSNHSDWIYVIKWGSCQVLKKLKEVRSQLTEHKERVVGFDNVRSLVPKADSRAKLDRVRTKLSVVALLLPKLTLRTLTEGSNEQDDDVPATADDGAVIEQVAAAQGMLVSLRSIRSPATQEDSLSNESSRSTSPPPRRTTIGRPRRASIPTGYSSSHNTADSCADGSKISRKRNVGFKGEDDKNSPEINSPPKFRRQRQVSSPLAPSPDSTTTTSRGNSPSSGSTKNLKHRTRMRSRSLRNSIGTTSVEDDEAHLPQQKISVIDEGAQKQSEVRITEADLHPMFVQVALLSKGDSFGVSPMVFNEQPSLSLVSNGAECIMISKKFYMSHCTDVMKRRLLTTETPYPNDDALQRSLQDKINWDAYKKKTIGRVIGDMPTLKRRLRDLQVHGQSKWEKELCQELKTALKKKQNTSKDS